jgi:hypothetical protein
MAVQYPIFRKDMVRFWTSGTIQNPLAGPLSQSAFFIGDEGQLQAEASGTAELAHTIPGGRRRRKEGGAENFDFFVTEKVAAITEAGIRPLGPANFFYSDVIPFEGIFKPLEYIGDDKRPVVLGDYNPVLYTDVSASVRLSASIVAGSRAVGAGGAVEQFTILEKVDDELYRLGMSNFMANIPRFFLGK